eukprot:5831028-Prymnesium_polylepis.1
MPLLVIIKLVDAVDFAAKDLLSLDRVHRGARVGDLGGEPLAFSRPVDVDSGPGGVAIVC